MFTKKGMMPRKEISRNEGKKSRKEGRIPRKEGDTKEGRKYTKEGRIPRKEGRISRTKGREEGKG